MSKTIDYDKKLQMAIRKVQILEEMVEVKTRDLYMINKSLNKANKELEQFTYLVSHDLNEPLRTINNFSTMLLDKIKDQLDDDSKQYLDYIFESTVRMQTLLKELLDFSQINGSKKKKRLFDLNHLLREIKVDMNSLIISHNVILRYDRLPKILAYPTYLRVLFQNLISNAIKFSKVNSTPIIRISCHEKNRFWEFCLEDNGIGIDPKNYKRIFLVFQRLHSRSAYDGTGIGLAHCKKIVEDLHGGKIWVDSVLGQRTSVYFTIPKE
tara:strand:- start:705 stop:1505 length:801 start_codon:yes stop_codon:yes gene_type:complete